MGNLKGKFFQKTAKILIAVILACLLATSALAAAPGFSDFEQSSGTTVDVPSVVEEIVSVITADVASAGENVKGAVADAIASVGVSNTAAVADAVVAAIAADGGNVVEKASEIAASIISEVSSENVVKAITDVVAAITNNSGASVSEVLASIVASVPAETLANLTVEFVTSSGVGMDMPAMNFLNKLIENNVTSVTFNSDVVSNSSATYTQAIESAASSSADYGENIEVAQVISLNLLDQNNNYISDLGGEVVISLPVVGNANAVAYLNPAGKLVMLPSHVKNGFIEFKTTHFSYFVLVNAPASIIPAFESAAPAYGASLVIPANVASNDEPKTNPKTSDAGVYLLIALSLAGAVGTTVFFRIKRTRASF